MCFFFLFNVVLFYFFIIFIGLVTIWIHIETIDENYQVISFERPENAVEYIRNFVVEQVQSMSAPSKKEVAVV